MKTLTITLVTLLIFGNVFGQDTADSTASKSKFEFYMNSGMGYYLPVKSIESISDSATTITFSFQVKYLKKYWARVYFDMSIIDYRHENIRVNEVLSKVEYKLHANSAGVDLGYTFQEDKFAPYVYGGMGVSFMDTPFIKPGAQRNEIVFGTKTKSFLQYRYGGGLAYEVSRGLSVYVEAQYSSTAFKTTLDNRPFQGMTLSLGIKTQL